MYVDCEITILNNAHIVRIKACMVHNNYDDDAEAFVVSVMQK